MGIVRKTKAVSTLLNVFDSGMSAVLAVDLVAQLKNEMNKTTVYRALERLESEGIVHSFVGKDGLKWYAKCSDCSSHHHNDVHPHFQCKKCDKVTCLQVEVTIPNIENYTVENASVFLTGVCKECS